MKRCFVGMLILILGVSFSGRCGAQEEENGPVAALPEVVVTGTRFEQKVEKIPARVTVIGAEEIQKSGAQSVPDILRSLGGVFVRDLNGNGNNQSVDMGGFGESADRHVAVLINGRRVNPIDQSGVRWSDIPVENIERIEVLHGAGSVLYGDNAMGGVINIVTRDWDGVTRIASEIGVGTWDTRKGHVETAFGKEGLGVVLGATRYRTDGYRDRSGKEQTHFYSKIRCDASDTVSLFFETDVNYSKVQFPGSLTEAQMDRNRKQSVNTGDEGMDGETTFVAGVEADWGEGGQWNLHISHRNENRDSDMASWWSYMTFNVRTNGLTTQYVLDRPLVGHDNRLTLGLDLYKTSYEATKGFFKGARTNLYDHSKRTLGGYVQNEWNVTDSLLLNVGLRYEKPVIKLGADVSGAVTNEEKDKGEWAWNAGIAWNFKPASKAYFRVYRSFRYPAVDEYTNLFTGAVNRSLEQESAVGYEAGVRLAPVAGCYVNIRAYWMDVKDEITWNSATQQNENLDKTRHIGVEMDVRYQPWDLLALYGGGGYARAEFTAGEDNGKRIPLVPDWKANAGIEVMPFEGCRFRVQYNYVGKRYFGNDRSNSGKRMDDYQTVDIYASYRVKGVEFFLNASNVFNEKYSDYGFYVSSSGTYYYYPMPEGGVYGGIRVDF
ncbi:MAG: TonB-dependent receptor [Deltaproteobacteria bacterium]|nr:TonB-dependent receptor [Deltaproteobacteria bacterium]